MSAIAAPGVAYSRRHADKLESLISIVGKWQMKAGLDLAEVLAALRYGCNKGEFEDACAEAEHVVQSYYGYKDMGEIE